MLSAAISTRNETPPIARGGWLDALRFIVAFGIILHHFQAAGPQPLSEAVHPVFQRGGFLLTNFFLIDSGYVLARVYGEAIGSGRMKAGDFVLKRLSRVWPAHLLMGGALAAIVLLGALAGAPPRNPEWFAWSELPGQLALVQAFGPFGGEGWNAPTWSISALVGCYLAFPWLLRGLSRLGPWTVLAVGVVGYLLVNQLFWGLIGYPTYQMPMQFGFWRALPLFVLGMILARFAQKVWIAPRMAAWGGVLAAVALAAAQAFGKNALMSLALISVIILAAGAMPVRRPSRWVETAAVVSFSMFITNEVVRVAWFGVVNIAVARFGWSEPVQWALWAAGVLAAVVFAFAFHFAVDEPIQSRIRAWLRRRGGAEPATRPVVSLEG